jgi:hypothetical protein
VKNEDQIAVHKDLEEDSKLFDFIIKLGTETIVGKKFWFTIINKGNIIQLPYVYFYFIKLWVGEGDHYRRVVKVGFICWSHGVYATVCKTTLSIQIHAV